MALDHSSGTQECADLGGGQRYWMRDDGIQPPVTMMAWAQIDSLTTRVGLTGMGRASDNASYGMRVEADGTFRYTHKDATATNRNFDFTAAGAITTGVWYHFALSTWGLTTSMVAIIGWVNGKIVGSGTRTIDGGFGTPNPCRGYIFQDGQSQFMNGKMAFARFFNARMHNGDLQRNIYSAVCPRYMRHRCFLDVPLDSATGPQRNLATAGGALTVTGFNTPVWTLSPDPPAVRAGGRY